jgi:hypothetical protein
MSRVAIDCCRLGNEASSKGFKSALLQHAACWAQPEPYLDINGISTLHDKGLVCNIFVPSCHSLRAALVALVSLASLHVCTSPRGRS